MNTFSSINFVWSFAVFVVGIGVFTFVPLATLYLILSTPYWLYAGTQANKGVISKDYVKNLSVGKMFISPFKFYYCLVFHKPYTF